MKQIATFLFSVAIAFAASARLPLWVENDSAEAVGRRIARDFPYGVDRLPELFPQLSPSQIKNYVDKGYIETLKVGDTIKVHRKAPRNYALLDPEQSGFKGRGAESKQSRRDIVAGILDLSNGDGTLSNLQEVTVRFSIDVPTTDFLKGYTLEMWLPVPVKSERQPDVRVLSSTPSTYVLSTPRRSVHNTAYFSVPVTGDTTHVEYVAKYIVGARYFSPEYIRTNIKPYRKESETYRKYTSFESPHIVKIDKVSEIVGNEKDPFKCSELVFDYIVRNYPWAGAREYSTIGCIPEYVVESGHGDCGQVALLYISMMRTLGIPARWESGWMLHPGEKNLHDWAEVYFEGVGWVPVDVSFGRYSNAGNDKICNFYSTGIDQWRLAANKGVNGAFYPEKTFIRSETVDSQMGEVECSKGNLFYPGWNQHLEILDIKEL